MVERNFAFKNVIYSWCNGSIVIIKLCGIFFDKFYKYFIKFLCILLWFYIYVQMTSCIHF